MNIFLILYNGALDKDFIHPKDQRRYDDFIMNLKIVVIVLIIVLLMIETTIKSGFLKQSMHSYQESKKTRLEKVIDKVVNKIKGKTTTYSTKSH